jgi:serine/threonine-protein kinase HipA
MSKSRANEYQTKDKLFVWWLGEPKTPVLVGELNLVRTPRGVSLRYCDDWCERGFALSEDLPLLVGQEFFPTINDTAAGAIDDARPDRWGERVIRFLDKPPRLSLMEYLYFAGDDRFGALGVSTSDKLYEPRRMGPLPVLADAEAMAELVRKVLANEPIAPEHQRLISPGATMGGARPKALMMIKGEPWVVKFSDGDPTDSPLVEHACMTLAAKANIRVAKTLAIRLTHGHAVAVKRFDRLRGQRVHCLSASVALTAAGETFGYPELAQLLRRRGVVEQGSNVEYMRELFRRMVFNILIDNTDDHEKNHCLVMSDGAQYALSPAYDVLPSGQALGFQQMRVGTDGADSTLDNALSMCRQFTLTRSEAIVQVKAVARIVATWKTHLNKQGVLRGDIELLEEQIDRPFLRNQRDEFVRG